MTRKGAPATGGVPDAGLPATIFPTPSQSIGLNPLDRGGFRGSRHAGNRFESVDEPCLPRGARQFTTEQLGTGAVQQVIEDEEDVLVLLALMAACPDQRDDGLARTGAADDQVLALPRQGAHRLLFLAQVLDAGQFESAFRHVEIWRMPLALRRSDDHAPLPVCAGAPKSAGQLPSASPATKVRSSRTLP